jgi:hypothetical protein
MRLGHVTLMKLAERMWNIGNLKPLNYMMRSLADSRLTIAHLGMKMQVSQGIGTTCSR